RAVACLKGDWIDAVSSPTDLGSVHALEVQVVDAWVAPTAVADGTNLRVLGHQIAHAHRGRREVHVRRVHARSLDVSVVDHHSIALGAVRALAGGRVLVRTAILPLVLDSDDDCPRASGVHGVTLLSVNVECPVRVVAVAYRVSRVALRASE